MTHENIDQSFCPLIVISVRVVQVVKIDRRLYTTPGLIHRNVRDKGVVLCSYSQALLNRYTIHLIRKYSGSLPRPLVGLHWTWASVLKHQTLTEDDSADEELPGDDEEVDIQRDDDRQDELWENMYE